MSDSDNPSSPKKEEMDVSENGDAGKVKEDSEDESKPETPKKESPKKEAPKKKETPKKKEAPQKKTPKEEDENEESEEDDDDDEEPPLGLLERPVELTSGKREKKKVDRLEMNTIKLQHEKKKLEIPEGKGTKLGECPRVEFKLVATKAVDLKLMHRLLFLKPATTSMVKKNIRQFSGFTFGKGDKEFEKRMVNLNKMTLAQLKFICEVLDVERGGTKPAIIERIMDFLMKPTSSGLPLPKSKTKKAKKEPKTKGTKRKRTPKKKESKPKAKKEKKEELSDLSDSDDEEEEEKEDKTKSASEEEEEDEEEETPPKKKAKVEKKSAAKETPKKEAAKKETPKAKKQNGKQEKGATAEKKEPKKKKVEISDDSDSDDEPLAAKKNEPPSNSELKDVINKILEGANLEEITMKTVVKQVYEKYPSFDLTDRKDFIKSTVREIIS